MPRDSAEVTARVECPSEVLGVVCVARTGQPRLDVTQKEGVDLTVSPPLAAAPSAAIVCEAPTRPALAAAPSAVV